MLGAARELIAILKQSRGAAETTGGANASAAATPTPASKPAGKPTPIPATATRSTDMVFNRGKPITEMSDLDKLRTELNNTTDETKRTQIYKRIKQAERDARL
jgi:hypothetical protein